MILTAILQQGNDSGLTNTDNGAAGALAILLIVLIIAFRRK